MGSLLLEFIEYCEIHTRILHGFLHGIIHRIIHGFIHGSISYIFFTPSILSYICCVILNCDMYIL